MSKERNDQMPWESDTEFNAWVRSLPEKTWAKNDISACRLGWEAHKHNLAQPEWPSEEDADRVWDALSERCGENDFPSIDDVRAALQSVRPPDGVVSDDRLQKAIGALLWINEEVWPLVHGLTSRETLRKRFRELPSLIEYLASRHAPIKD